MKLPHLVACFLVGIGVAGIILTLVEVGSVRHSRKAITAAEQREKSANQQIATLEAEVQAGKKKAEAIEHDNRQLVAAMEQARKTPHTQAWAKTTSVSSTEIEARIKRATAQAETGDPEAALRELLWCYDEGLEHLSGSMRRTQPRVIANSLSKLSERFPPAQSALLERLEKAKARLLAATDDAEAVAEISTLSRVLKDQNAITSVYDQIPPGDPRRKSLAIYGFEQFVELRRYEDALLGRDYAMMSSAFELQTRPLTPPPDARDPGRMKRLLDSYAVSRAASNIEVLAGTGDMEHARALAERLLNHDPSEETRALVRKHAERAGRPDLLTLLPPP